MDDHGNPFGTSPTIPTNLRSPRPENCWDRGSTSSRQSSVRACCASSVRSMPCIEAKSGPRDVHAEKHTGVSMAQDAAIRPPRARSPHSVSLCAAIISSCTARHSHSTGGPVSHRSTPAGSGRARRLARRGAAGAAGFRALPAVVGGSRQGVPPARGPRPRASTQRARARAALLRGATRARP